MFNTGGNDDLAIPGPVAEPQVESKSPKWVGYRYDKGLGPVLRDMFIFLLGK